MARMKILLTEDIPSLGMAGEVHSVARGYARNYLIPRREAIVATRGALKQAEEIRQTAVRKRAQEFSNAEAQAQVLNGQQLLFEVRAGDNDRLYGSITTSEIAERLTEAVAFEVDRRRIMLGASIRELGLYDLTIRLMPEVEATFAVAAVREGESWADAQQREKDREAAAQALLEEEAAAELIEGVSEADSGGEGDEDEQEE